MHKLWLVGGGSGQPDYLLPLAKQVLEQADCVIASERFLKLAAGKKQIPMKQLSALLEQLPTLLENDSVAILVSGDPLLYSFYRTVRNRYPDWDITVIPGIGSLQLLGAKFGLTMEDAFISSLHGKPYTAGSIACAVAQHALTFFFCSATTMYIGADLTYETEQTWSGAPEQFCSAENPALCVTAVRNPNPKPVGTAGFLPDDAFLRNGAPMTKEEVRAVIISKLRLQPDSIVWDLGAGTGSVSITCAKCCPYGQVYAVEYQEQALDILRQNCAYLQAENVTVVAGRAEDMLSELPVPDCIFIGGSNGAFPEILQQIQQLPKPVRLVVSAVTLETQAEVTQLLQGAPQLEVIPVFSGQSRKVGRYHVLQPHHPVLLFACTGGKTT